MQNEFQEWLKNNPQPKPDDAFVNQLRRKLHDEANKYQRLPHSKLYRWVTGCSSMAAAIVLLLFLLLPHEVDSFAAMQQIIRHSDYVAADIHMQLDMPDLDKSIPLCETQSWITREGGIRSDINVLGQPTLQLWHPWQGNTLLINHLQRTTTPIHLPPDIAPEELLQFNPANLITQISRFTGKPQPIPSEDQSLIGYRINSRKLQLPENARIEVWVDQDTNRPKQITCKIPMPNGINLLWVADQFTWDDGDGPVKIEPDLPEGYTQNAPLVVPPPSLDAVAMSLKHYAKHNMGMFPSHQAFPWQAAMRAAMIMQQPEQIKNKNLAPRVLNGLADALAGGIYLLRVRQQDATIQYRGQNVRLGDEKELLRIRLADGTIQTIDGNLNTHIQKP